MDERKIRILQAIIKDYINSGEPVGSRTIAKKYDLGVSSATIRNEMADLEDMGYLEQIHSSSGRKPSDKGYRLYVDKLMTLTALTEQEKMLIKDQAIDSALYEIDKTIRHSISILSEITKLTCLVKTPSMIKSRLKSIQIIKVDKYNLLLIVITDNAMIKNTLLRVTKEIDEGSLIKINNLLNRKLKGLSLREVNLELLNELKKEMIGYGDILKNILSSIYEVLTDIEDAEIYMEGTTNIFNYPEYNDVDRAKEFLSMLNDREKVEELLYVDSDIAVKIGKENFVEDAKQCSVISAVYSIGKTPIGTIGVIGPTRIPYEKIISAVATIVKAINDTLTDDKNIHK